MHKMELPSEWSERAVKNKKERICSWRGIAEYFKYFLLISFIVFSQLKAISGNYLPSTERRTPILGSLSQIFRLYHKRSIGKNVHSFCSGK